MVLPFGALLSADAAVASATSTDATLGAWPDALLEKDTRREGERMPMLLIDTTYGKAFGGP